MEAGSTEETKNTSAPSKVPAKDGSEASAAKLNNGHATETTLNSESNIPESLFTTRSELQQQQPIQQQQQQQPSTSVGNIVLPSVKTVLAEQTIHFQQSNQQQTTQSPPLLSREDSHQEQQRYFQHRPPQPSAAPPPPPAPSNTQPWPYYHNQPPRSSNPTHHFSASALPQTTMPHPNTSMPPNFSNQSYHSQQPHPNYANNHHQHQQHQQHLPQYVSNPPSSQPPVVSHQPQHYRSPTMHPSQHPTLPPLAPAPAVVQPQTSHHLTDSLRILVAVSEQVREFGLTYQAQLSALLPNAPFDHALYKGPMDMTKLSYSLFEAYRRLEEIRKLNNVDTVSCIFCFFSRFFRVVDDIILTFSAFFLSLFSFSLFFPPSFPRIFLLDWYYR